MVCGMIKTSASNYLYGQICLTSTKDDEIINGKQAHSNPNWEGTYDIVLGWGIKITLVFACFSVYGTQIWIFFFIS